MKKIITLLKLKQKTIASMESCTGGAFADTLTNIPGASDVFKFGAVTYANEFKVKMGVSKQTIEDYTVYSMEVAHEMSANICTYASSNYGIGITGHMMVPDKKNLVGDLNKVYISIYDCDNNKYYQKDVELRYIDRVKNKKFVVKIIEDMLIEILK